MKIIARDFIHHQAVHCGSGAMSDLFRHAGLEADEAYCFGMGSGLFMLYAHHGPFGAPPFVCGRAPELENALCRRLGARLVERHKKDFASFWERAKSEISAGRPVLCQADMHYLGYLNARDHMGGHRIVLAGYDDEAGEAYIADRELEGLQTATLEEFEKAWTSEKPPIPAGRTYFEFAPPERKGAPGAEGLADALEGSAANMLDHDAPMLGVNGIRLLADEAPRFPEIFPDDELTAATRLVYLYAEVSGTGGGNFRLLFARFLEQMARRSGHDGLARSAEAFKESAALWCAAAYDFLDVTKTRNLEGLKKASGRLERIADLEEAELRRIRSEVAPSLASA